VSPFSGQTRAFAHRLHGPEGYNDYTAYKPWLRDEFEYRCAYCQWRERWNFNKHSGADDFAVEHVQPKSLHPDLTTSYQNLVYACTFCNTRKLSHVLPSVLVQLPLSEHIRFAADGRVEPTTPAGEWLVDALLLNHPGRVEWRQIMLEMWQKVSTSELTHTSTLHFFAYPNDIPNLAALRPPANSKNEGILECAWNRHVEGRLPRIYG
jgi:HNH endonuclease